MVARPRVNITILNHIFLLDIYNVHHFFNTLMITCLCHQGQGWGGSIQLYRGEMCTGVFIIKFKDHRDIKRRKYSFGFYVQTLLLPME